MDNAHNTTIVSDLIDQRVQIPLVPGKGIQHGKDWIFGRIRGIYISPAESRLRFIVLGSDGYMYDILAHGIQVKGREETELE